MLLWGVACFLACVLAALGWRLLAANPEQQRLQQRLHAITPHLAGEVEAAAPLFRLLDVRGLAAVWLRLEVLLGRENRLALVAGWVLVISVAVFLLRGWGSAGVIAALVAGVVVIPVMLLKWLEQRRIERFEAEFPRALEVIVRVISAGGSLPQAFDQVAESQQGLVANEFEYIISRLRLGIPMAEALSESAWRIPSLRLRYFVVAVQLNMDSGGQLAEVLNRLARSMHQQRATEQKMKTLTAEPRSAARIVAFIPVGMMAFMYFMGPERFDFLIDDPTGQKLLAYIVISVLTGLIVINRMAKV